MRRALTLYTALTSGKARLIRFALGGIASLGLGWLASRGLSWGQALDALGGLPLPVVALALLVFFISNLVRAYRWRLLFLKERISVARLFLIENIGQGVNNLLPVRIASEATQFTILTLRDGVSRGTALATLGMIRVMDIWANSLILAVSLLFIHSAAGQLARYAAGSLLFSLVLLALVRFVSWGSRGLPLLRRLPLLSTFAASVAEMEKRKDRLVASLAASLAAWVILGLSGWIVARSMGIPLSLAQVLLVILSTIFFATAIPSLPGAIGTFEAVMVYVMGIFGVDKNLAFPYALFVHALVFLPPILMAAIFLPREGMGSLRRSLSKSWSGSSPTEQA
ncbi:MAG: conserved rane protein of unknown function [Dehalococcoidia bacterium]|nr:conserved rane protein of unknown function [Dehalococcoidia bacterium]